jgi:predicted dehydrogenase
MGRTLRLGQLGAGFIGQMHSLAFGEVYRLRRDPVITAELVAIADRDRALAETVAARYRWAHILDDWRAIVARPDIDLFLNSGPNDLHAEPCIAAAKAGKHVFVEKPLARTADEAHALWQGVAATGVKHMCAFMHRFIPALRLARTMIAEGELGEIRHYRSTFLLNMVEPDRPLSWRYDGNLAGGGATGDLGSHHIDLARYLVGDVARVRAMTRRWTNDPSGRTKTINDDWFGAVAEMENGATAVFEACRVDTPHSLTARIEVDGTKGSIRFEMERLNELSLRWPGAGARTIMAVAPTHPFADYLLPVGIQGAHSIGWTDCFTFQAHHMMNAIATDTPVEPHGASLRDGYRTAEIVDAILRAASSGATEDVRYRD